MSAVNLLSSLKERPNEESPKDDPDHEGHEEEERPAGGGGGGGGSGDPAVLAVGVARRPLVYTRDQLLRLRHSPLVKRNLENAFAGCEALALVLKRRSDSPNEEDRGARGDAPNENHKGVYGRERDRERRSADPRERVRKESEPSGGGIVLSPQRRSFTSGCGAPAAHAAHAAHPAHAAHATHHQRRAESPPPPANHQPHNAKMDQGRRIGSGRIMVRDSNATWEEGEWTGEPYRRERAERPERDDRHNATRNNDRFDRRSFTRDSYSSDIKRERDDRFNNDKPREDNRRSGGRYSQRRFEKEDEPEWFSGGPTSQLETIELRGFDEPTHPKKPGKDSEKWNNSGGSRSPERWRSEAASPANANNANTSANSSANSTNANANAAANADSTSEKEAPAAAPTPAEPAGEQPDFNLDEFLKFDAIPDVLTNGGGESEGGSRFSRWFRRESPPAAAPAPASAPTSHHDQRHYERLLHHMVDDLDSNSGPAPAAVPAGESRVFAPISPAAAPHSLLDLLRRANAAQEQRIEPANAMGATKIHSLEELEARLRPQPPPAQHDHDLSAFKRLLAQVSGGHAVPAEARAPAHAAHPTHPPHAPHAAHAAHAAHAPHAQHQPQPMSLLQMLNKSVEQQSKPAAPAPAPAPAPAAAAPPHIPQELLYKLLQVQQRQQQQQQQAALGEHGGGAGPSPADRDLLLRPEAQAIIHGLKAGEITAAHLLQQLGNPGLQSRHRDVLHTILRLHQHQRQVGGSPLPVGGVGAGAPAAAAPHLVVPHHQPLRLSPLPHPSVPARIPSPRELAAHTQSIMQGALIKKKLEEQRENYRRRHEMHAPKQPTPISFTPTSVLRKMTAEKEAEAASPKQWSQPPKMPQGRPIVKGNQSGAPPLGYAAAPDYQQHYLNQQQQMVGGVRPFPHQQQRQMPASFNNMSAAAMARGAAAAGGATLHQLLVQSQQRGFNEMGGGGGSGGGDNQLARWFSPELLARASAGKLPSVHVPNALSLEDLERHHHSPAPPVRN